MSDIYGDIYGGTSPSPNPFGPCESWPFDELCCDLPDDTDPAVIARWQAVATNILWTAGGRRHGPCPITVRPCLRSCDGGFGAGPWKGADGEWRNSFCGCPGDCSCESLCIVVLDGIVSEIVSVTIDGIELDPDSYRLDIVNGGYQLLRTNGLCWPECQMMTADCNEPGSFCVTYMRGLPLDELAIAAVSDLTCQLVRGCLGLPCALPKNVTAITRRGVSISFDQSRWWLFTLPQVANWLNAVNPRGWTSGADIWTPDIQSQRVMTTPPGS